MGANPSRFLGSFFQNVPFDEHCASYDRSIFGRNAFFSVNSWVSPSQFNQQVFQVLSTDHRAFCSRIWRVKKSFWIEPSWRSIDNIRGTAVWDHFLSIMWLMSVADSSNLKCPWGRGSWAWWSALFNANHSLSVVHPLTSSSRSHTPYINFVHFPAFFLHRHDQLERHQYLNSSRAIFVTPASVDSSLCLSCQLYLCSSVPHFSMIMVPNSFCFSTLGRPVLVMNAERSSFFCITGNIGWCLAALSVRSIGVSGFDGFGRSIDWKTNLL